MAEAGLPHVRSGGKVQPPLAWQLGPAQDTPCPFSPSLPTEEGPKSTPLTSISHKGFLYPVEMGKHISCARNPHLRCQGHIPASRPRLGLHLLKH